MGLLTKGNSPNDAFWQAKEGKYGKVILGLLGVVAIIGLAKALPFMRDFVMDAADFTWQMIRFISLLALAGSIGWIVTRPDFRNMVFYWFKGIVSKMVTGYAEKSFIQIMQTYMDRCDEKVRIATAHISHLIKSKGAIQKDIDTYEKDIAEYLDKASKLKRLIASEGPEGNEERHAGFKREIIALSGKAATLNGSLSVLKDQVARLDMMYKVVDKVCKYAGIMAEKLRFNTNILITEHKHIASAHSALTGAQNAVMGGSEEDRLFKQSMEIMTRRTGEDMGEIEAMLNGFKGMIVSNDADNALYEADGLKMLEEWDATMDAKMNDGLSFLDPVHLNKHKEPAAIAASKGSDSPASKWLK